MRTWKAFFGSRGRRAYSLTEVLVATALTSMVLSQAGIALISSARMFEATVADMELSLQSRALREKLLYHINTDGGMMKACQSGLSLVGGGNVGNGIVFKPVNGVQNTVTLNASKKFAATQSLNNNWLNCGTLVIQGTNFFSLTNSATVVNVTLDVAINIATRTYTQRNLVKVQVMNNK